MIRLIFSIFCDIFYHNSIIFEMIFNEKSSIYVWFVIRLWKNECEQFIWCEHFRKR